MYKEKSLVNRLDYVLIFWYNNIHFFTKLIISSLQHLQCEDVHDSSRKSFGEKFIGNQVNFV